MTAPRAILHIGAEKTGSTALQETLAAHRQTLRDHDVVYSLAAGASNHLRLVAFAASRDDMRRGLGATDAGSFRTETADALAAEIRAAPAATHVYSSELCHSRLPRQEEVDRLAALLHGLFAEVTVVLYLRRQDAMAVSRRSTLLKVGRTDVPFFPETANSHRFYDFWALTQRWEHAFGRDALRVRRFAPGAGAGVPIVTDFCAAMGLPPVPEPDRPHNLSLRPAWQHLLGALNARIPRLVDGRPNPARGALDRLVVELGAGRGARPRRRDARRFLRRFAAGNDQVRARYFPELDRLFDTDFSDYPEEGDPATPPQDAIYDAVADLWRTAVTGS